MAKKNWNDLTTAQRGAVIGVTAVDAGLRLWAGSDLATRTPDEVRGPKWLWGLGLSVVNSMGVLPVVYLLAGRRTGESAAVPD